MREMTARQREVLDFIRASAERHGVPPTVREIGERVRVHGPRGIRPPARARAQGHARAPGHGQAGLADPGPAERGPGGRCPREIPVVGRIAAGAPILAAVALIAIELVIPHFNRAGNVELLHTLHTQVAQCAWRHRAHLR